MEYGYRPELKNTKIIDIADEGNCAIEGIDAFEQNHYLIIKTVLGLTEILRYGPIVPGASELPDSVEVSYSAIEYNIKKIRKIIKSFLVGQVKMDEVRVVELDYALDQCVNIADFLR